ncbi:CDC27 family protein [Hydrogenimonas sp.]
MLEIEKLERDWRRYRAKRLRPWILSFLTLVLAFSGYLLLQESGQTSLPFKMAGIEAKKEVTPSPAAAAEAPSPIRKLEKPAATEERISPAADEAAVEKEPRKRPEPQLQEEKTAEVTPAPKQVESSVTLNPDTDFLATLSDSMGEREQSGSRRAVAAEPVRHETIASAEPVPKPRSTSASEEPHGISEPQKERGGSTLMIESSKANNTLEYLIKRFDEKRDPKLASYIAQSFYKKGKYEEAVRWSVMANSLDPSSEETWLIFARAKVRLGEKEDAIKALRTYLNQYTSRNVKSFLQSLESGR